MNLFLIIKQPNDLHKKIVRLNLKNLITTNWDNLFEKAIDDEGCFYNIIKKDEDIGFATGFSKLIKMHGSLEEQNIVFKETDYLRYSDNFPLIENYIKGVFSTDLVVLMGYSLSDSNVKQIISWVTSKARNIKPVYLVKINKGFDKLEFDFYKNKNIYILYLDEIYKKDTNNYSTNIVELFLNDLDKKCYDLNTLNDQEINDKVEEFLQKYKSCKFIFPHLFLQDFKQYFKLDGNDVNLSIKHILISNEKLANFVNEENYKIIANLTKTPIYINSKCIEPNYDNIKDINSILYFDYDNIEKEIEKFLLKDLSDEEELSLAFWLYQNEHYIQSYTTLKRVSKNAFKNKDYITWLISEINRANFVFKNITEENEDEIKKYLKEMNEINIDELYLKLPKKNRIEIKSLKELESFMDKKLIKINDLSEKILRDYNIYKNGGFSMNDNISFIVDIYKKILEMEIDFKLIYDFRAIYKKLMESFIIYLAYYGLQEEKRVKAKQKNNNKEDILININIYMLSFTIKYIEHKDLISIFDKYFKQNYILKLDNNENINRIYKNICKSFTTNGFFTTTYSKLFDNFLIFSSWMNLTQESFDLIIDKFNEKLENNLLGLNQYNSMSDFLYNQYNKNKNINFSNIATIIEKYINISLNNNFRVYFPLEFNIFDIIFNILIDKKIKLKDSFNLKISEFITNLKNKNIAAQHYYVRHFLEQLTRVVSENIQKELNEFNSEVYNQVKNENKG